LLNSVEYAFPDVRGGYLSGVPTMGECGGGTITGLIGVEPVEI
jgi:hypothetical protein